MSKVIIPKSLKISVWNKFIGDIIGKTKCLCCENNDITQSNFECGHIEAEANGGETSINNLVPICSQCNKSMGTTNYIIFKNQLKGHLPLYNKKIIEKTIKKEQEEKKENKIIMIDTLEELKKYNFKHSNIYLCKINDEKLEYKNNNIPANYILKQIYKTINDGVKIIWCGGKKHR